MGDRVKGKNAIVTGAGRGIGAAVSVALAQEGANVVVCDIGGATDGSGTDKTPADEVVEKCKSLGVKAVAHYGNVADFNACADMVKRCVETFGSVDIVCNIAGIDKPKMVWNMSEEEWDAVVAVHLKGTFNLTRHSTPLMREQKSGRIINCVSEAYQGGPGHLNYAAAKGGIASLTYGTARELGRYGVTCNAFIPRARTRMLMDEATLAGLQKRVAAGVMTQEKFDSMLRSLAPAETFAPFITYLASEAAANINGQIFLTTGESLGVFSQPEITVQVTRDWEKEGGWSIEEIEKLVPEKLLVGYVNPSPPKTEDKK